MKRAVVGSFVVVCAAAFGACSEPVDLASAIRVDSATTRWIDEGIVGGQHKIVPTATFTLKNISGRQLRFVQLNAVFRQVGTAAEWSAAFVPEAAKDLAPGASTAVLLVKGEKGYTGSDRPDALLTHPQFVDAKVDIFVKAGSSNWTKLAELQVDRRWGQISIFAPRPPATIEI